MLEVLEKPKSVARNIWIIDKDSFLRNTLARQLEIWGYKVMVINTQKEAVGRLQTETWPDMVLMEMELLEGEVATDWFKVLEHVLENQSHHPFCYFIYLVEKGHELDAKLAVGQGAHEIIEKPIRNLEWMRARVEMAARNVNVIRSIEEKNIVLAENYELIYQVHERIGDVIKRLQSQKGDRAAIEELRGIRENTAEASQIYQANYDKKRKEAEAKAAKETALKDFEKDKKMRVLVVDDNKNNRKLLTMMLKPQAICEEAENGLEAVKLYEEYIKTDDPFKLILMDLVMPEMDGHAALKKIREIERSRQITRQREAVIAILTSLDDRENMVLTHEEGCNHYIIKPFTREKLKKLFSKM